MVVRNAALVCIPFIWIKDSRATHTVHSFTCISFAGIVFLGIDEWTC